MDYVWMMDVPKIRIVSNQVEFAEIVAVLFNVQQFTVLVLQDSFVLKIAFAFKENVKKIRIADLRLFALTDSVTWIVYEIRIVPEDWSVKTPDVESVKVTRIAHNRDPDAEMENVPKENVMIKKIVRNCIKPASMANARTSPVWRTKTAIMARSVDPIAAKSVSTPKNAPMDVSAMSLASVSSKTISASRVWIVYETFAASLANV